MPVAVGRGLLFGVRGLVLSALLSLGFVPGACADAGQEIGVDAGNHHYLPPDAGSGGDGAVTDAGADGAVDDPCVGSAKGRTGTTLYVLDDQGNDSVDPIEEGTVVTVSVRITIDNPPPGNVGYVELRPFNLRLDTSSFALDGNPFSVPDPFVGRIPLTLAAGSSELTFKASVDSRTSTIELDAFLRYGPAAVCSVPESHSLAVLQVLGGVTKGSRCYNMDDARSVQVTPAIPLQSTGRYQTANGFYGDVVIGNLVVGGPQCPGPSVLVHQITKCFTLTKQARITLSGNAYGGTPWSVDDLLLVEVLDQDDQVVSAFTTYQVANKVLGCCTNPPCTSSVSYVPSGPNVSIENEIQGGGDNGEIAPAVFDLTDHLPHDGHHFSLRFTAIDQGVQGELSRVFINLD